MNRTSIPRTAVRLAVLILLFTAGALIEKRHLTSLSSLASADAWWHLRVGTWMLDNHATPRHALFSQDASQAWVDSSWAFDGVMGGAYCLFGLRALPILLMVLRVKLAVLLFWLAGGWRGRFWPAVLISACAQYVLGSFGLVSAYVSLLMFSVELGLLLEYRRTGQRRLLFVLPILSLLWANFDAQFVVGIALLAIFVLVSIVESVLQRGSSSPFGVPQLSEVTLAALLSLAAACATPYFVAPYRVLFQQVTSSANSYLPDFRALQFKQPQDYLLLLLTMAAFLTLGLRRSRDTLQILTLVLCAAASFHAQRDLWLVTIAATAILGDAFRTPADQTAISSTQEPATQLAIPHGARLPLAACVAGIVALAALRIPSDREALLARAGETFPVRACDVIRERHLPQPLFNPYEWGGFVMWYLPEYPVPLDSRPGMYSGDAIVTYSKVMNADLPYTADSSLVSAPTLLLARHSLMGEALKDLPAFRTAYSDDVAIVLIRGE